MRDLLVILSLFGAAIIISIIPIILTNLDDFIYMFKKHTHTKHTATYKPQPKQTPIKTTHKTATVITKTNEWQVINKHGFSINKMYECSSNGKNLRCTMEYESWRIRMLHKMEMSGLKSLDDMNVDPTKPMKIEIEFKLVRGSDTDNPIKSFIDTLVKYYGLKDDNNFYVINASRDFTPARNYEDGRIKFRITNIDKNDKGQITEVKIIKEKIEVPKTIIKEVEVIKHVENKCSDFNEKELSRLTIENKRKEAKINELKKQLEAVSKTVVEIPKEVVKEVTVIKEVPKTIIKEVVKEDNRYKILYEKYKIAYETLKTEVDNRNTQINYNTQSKFVKTDTYRQQLERIKQMKNSY